MARTLVGDASTADDVAQEAWVSALQHPPAERAGARPWLARVLRNAVRQRHRGEERRRRRELEADAIVGLSSAFFDAYGELFERRVEDVPIETMSWRLQAQAPAPSLAFDTAAPAWSVRSRPEEA